MFLSKTIQVKDKVILLNEIERQMKIVKTLWGVWVEEKLIARTG